jgi:threonine/homoserine/homoserine lactone efflux protein
LERYSKWMLLDPTLTLAYIIIATAVAISPGPDVLFVVASAMRHRAKGAFAAALGIGAGSALHAFAAALGVSAIIAASPLAFDVLRYGGAAYLLFLGCQALLSFFRSASESNSQKVETKVSVWRVFQHGLITNLLNPKVIVFYLALLPQFVKIELGNVGLQIFLLGCIHNLIGLAFLTVIGLAAGRASQWLQQTGFARWMDGIAGIFFIGIAIRLIVSDNSAQ